MNKFSFFCWERLSSCADIGFCIRVVNQNLPKSRKKEFIQKEIDAQLERYSDQKRPIPYLRSFLRNLSLRAVNEIIKLGAKYPDKLSAN